MDVVPIIAADHASRLISESIAVKQAILDDTALLGEIEAQLVRFRCEPQHEPALFLADTQRRAVAAHEFVGETISQPVGRNAQQLDVIALEADFLTKFAVHRVLRILTNLHAALRELPPLAAGATAQQASASWGVIPGSPGADTLRAASMRMWFEQRST